MIITTINILLYHSNIVYYHFCREFCVSFLLQKDTVKKTNWLSQYCETITAFVSSINQTVQQKLLHND